MSVVAAARVRVCVFAIADAPACWRLVALRFAQKPDIKPNRAAIYRAAWTSGRTLRRQFTAPSAILQAAWARFSETGARRALCLLHRLSITTMLPGGAVQETPLLQPCAAMWPLVRGLLLVGPFDCSSCLLTHPLEEPQPVVADCALQRAPPGAGATAAAAAAAAADPESVALSGWANESVVWAGEQLPFVATYNDVSFRCLCVFCLQIALRCVLQRGLLHSATRFSSS